MAYQTKFNKKKAFSLLELLIVIAIFSIFVGMGTSVYYSMKSHTNLELGTSSMVEAVRFAESSSQSGKADSKWGVKILTNKIIIFKGDSYALRDTSFDSIFDLPAGVSGSGLSEIIFEKVSGATANTGTIVLTNGTESKNLVVNSAGTVSY
jgi:prepilin-type N-terminal cleavage/methylation domain-containing protein